MTAGELGPYPEHVPTAADVRGLALTLAVELYKGYLAPLDEQEARDSQVLATADRFTHWLATGESKITGLEDRPARPAPAGCSTFPRPAGLPPEIHWHECAGPEAHGPAGPAGQYGQSWHRCRTDGCDATFATHHQPSGYYSPSGKMLCACGDLWPCKYPPMNPPPP